MKIAIISDTHDNLINFKKATTWIEKQKIKKIIHCGDICSPSVLKKALEKFSGKIYLVFGNADGDRFLMTKYIEKDIIPNAVIYGELGKVKIGNKKIAFTHFPEFAKGLAYSGQYDIVFYGHTHKPWQEKINNCYLVNPGNLAGLFYKATFAVYNTENNKLELKILERL